MEKIKKAVSLEKVHKIRLPIKENWTTRNNSVIKNTRTILLKKAQTPKTQKLVVIFVVLFYLFIIIFGTHN